MPEGWSKPRELAKLADRRAQFAFEIPVGELPGIPEEFSLAEGPAHVALQFGRERGLAVAHVQVQAVLVPLCQRCLRPMRLPVAADSHVALVGSEAQAAEVPEEFETFLAADGHGSLAALAAEELLLALPIVPRHGAAEGCSAAGQSAEGAAGPEGQGTPGPTQRPFAELRALLERDKS